eukprot:PLAT2536.1.p1 GENE.PLAT2536.1~~PLAT2536.1.p1  ORF type:complete len:1403 (-),score=655.87 PLAT2536.1:229-4416(-)
MADQLCSFPPDWEAEGRSWVRPMSAALYSCLLVVVLARARDGAVWKGCRAPARAARSLFGSWTAFWLNVSMLAYVICYLANLWQPSFALDGLRLMALAAAVSCLLVFSVASLDPLGNERRVERQVRLMLTLNFLLAFLVTITGSLVFRNSTGHTIAFNCSCLYYPCAVLRYLVNSIANVLFFAVAAYSTARWWLLRRGIRQQLTRRRSASQSLSSIGSMSAFSTVLLEDAVRMAGDVDAEAGTPPLIAITGKRKKKAAPAAATAAEEDHSSPLLAGEHSSAAIIAPAVSLADGPALLLVSRGDSFRRSAVHSAISGTSSSSPPRARSDSSSPPRARSDSLPLLSPAIGSDWPLTGGGGRPQSTRVGRSWTSFWWGEEGGDDAPVTEMAPILHASRLADAEGVHEEQHHARAKSTDSDRAHAVDGGSSRARMSARSASALQLLQKKQIASLKQLVIAGSVLTACLLLRTLLYAIYPAACLTSPRLCREGFGMYDAPFYTPLMVWLPELPPLLAFLLLTWRRRQPRTRQSVSIHHAVARRNRPISSQRASLDLHGEMSVGGVDVTAVSSGALPIAATVGSEGDAAGAADAAAAAAAGAVEGEAAVLQLQVSCTELVMVNEDMGLEIPVLFSQKKAFISLSTSPDGLEWTELTRTEVVTRASRPVWAVELLLPFKEGVDQRLQLRVYNFNSSGDRLQAHDPIGQVQLSLSDLLAVPRSTPYGVGLLKRVVDVDVSGAEVVEPAVMSIASRRMQLSTMDHTYCLGGGRIMQAYSLRHRNGYRRRRLRVVEELVESPFTFDLPAKYLMLLAMEERARAKADGGDEDDRVRHSVLAREYRQQAQLLRSLPGFFKSSTLKKDHDLAYVATNLHIQVMHVTEAQPGHIYRHSHYDFVTVGAFAAHALRFKQLGLRQMLDEVNKLGRLLKRCSDEERPRLKRKLRRLTTAIYRRRPVAFAQGLAALLTSFARRIELMTKGELAILSRVGFLMQVESLISTAGKELGMLGDMDVVVQELSSVRFQLLPPLKADGEAEVEAEGGKAGEDEEAEEKEAEVGAEVEAEVEAEAEAAVDEGKAGDDDDAGEESGDADVRLGMPAHVAVDDAAAAAPAAAAAGKADKPTSTPLGIAFKLRRVRGHLVIQLPVMQTVWDMLPSELRAGALVSVTAVLFQQGVNEMQSLVNAVGDSTLQDTINLENLERLETYFYKWRDEAVALEAAAAVGEPPGGLVLVKQVTAALADSDAIEAEMDRAGAVAPPSRHVASDLGLSSSIEDRLERLERQLTNIRTTVTEAVGKRRKAIEILSLTAEFTRNLAGGRVTCCKSAKDRTSMSVTLEQMRLLQQEHKLERDVCLYALSVMRSNGVRRGNARKNIGKDRYAFNRLQRRMLPRALRPPASVIGARTS